MKEGSKPVREVTEGRMDGKKDGRKVRMEGMKESRGDGWKGEVI